MEKLYDSYGIGKRKISCSLLLLMRQNITNPHFPRHSTYSLLSAFLLSCPPVPLITNSPTKTLSILQRNEMCLLDNATYLQLQAQRHSQLQSSANESNLLLSGNVNQLDTQSINDVSFD